MSFRIGRINSLVKTCYRGEKAPATTLSPWPFVRAIFIAGLDLMRFKVYSQDSIEELILCLPPSSVKNMKRRQK